MSEQGDKTLRGRETKREIREIARQMLKELPRYSALNMAELSKRAGVAVGTPYIYWLSKEDLIVDALGYDPLDFELVEVVRERKQTVGHLAFHSKSRHW